MQADPDPGMLDPGGDLTDIDPETGGRARGSGPPGRGVWWLTLAVIAAGGAAGALARYGLDVAFPARPGGFDGATLGVNAAGCAVIGVLLAAIAGRWRAHHLIRPFAVTGVLGGFTTFSTYITDAQRSLDAGAPGTALAYLSGTLALCLAATAAGIALAHRAGAGRQGGAGHRGGAGRRGGAGGR
jgi:CrcB protein